MELGRIENAVIDYSRAIEIDPQSALINRGRYSFLRI